MITVDLGWAIARIKYADREVTSIEILTPPDASEHGVIQSQYVYLGRNAVVTLLQAIDRAKGVE